MLYDVTPESRGIILTLGQLTCPCTIHHTLPYHTSWHTLDTMCLEQYMTV